MQLISLDTHFPEFSYNQTECLDAMQKSPFWGNLTDRSHRLLNKIFTSDTGINKRHFCIPELEKIWTMSASELNQYYEQMAPKVGASALEKALQKANLTASDIDVLLISSCTGYLCPGVSSYIAEVIGCRPDIYTQDLTGHGCGAAIPLIQIANGYSSSMPEAVIATVAVEICSAAFYISNEIDVLISTCLFGDGAAAALWSSSGGNYTASHFHSLHLPQEREKVRFVNANGKLKNQLDKTVPSISSKAASDLYKKSSQPNKVITHGGGRDVIHSLQETIPSASLTETKNVLTNYGNLSSPSVLVALDQYLSNDPTDETIWLCSFGAGFSAHSMELHKV